jgi:hypothetical protein
MEICFYDMDCIQLCKIGPTDGRFRPNTEG